MVPQIELCKKKKKSKISVFVDYEFSVAAIQICYCSIRRGEPRIGCMGRRDEFSNETSGVVGILFNCLSIEKCCLSFSFNH